MNKAITLMILATVAHVSFIQCMDNKNEDIIGREKCLLYNWTGLSIGSYIVKNRFNRLAELPEYAMKQEQYLKYANYSRGISRFAILPFKSFIVSIGTLMLYNKYKDTIFDIPAGGLVMASSLPLNLMVCKPIEAYDYFKSQKNNKISQ